MNVRWLRVDAPAAAIVIRLGVGAVFFLEGIKKFLFPADWGAGRHSPAHRHHGGDPVD